MEVEERFGYYKRKFNTMISSLQDSHHLNKLNFSMPWKFDYMKVQENIVHEYLESFIRNGTPSRLSVHGREALDILKTTSRSFPHCKGWLPTQKYIVLPSNLKSTTMKLKYQNFHLALQLLCFMIGSNLQLIKRLLLK